MDKTNVDFPRPYRDSTLSIMTGPKVSITQRGYWRSIKREGGREGEGGRERGREGEGGREREDEKGGRYRYCRREGGRQRGEGGVYNSSVQYTLLCIPKVVVWDAYVTM